MREASERKTHRQLPPLQERLPRLQGRPQAPAAGRLALVWAWETGTLASCLQAQRSFSVIPLSFKERCLLTG